MKNLLLFPIILFLILNSCTKNNKNISNQSKIVNDEIESQMMKGRHADE